MSVQGNLKTTPLADLLQGMAQGHNTGTLVIDNGRIEKRIFFRDGAVIASASTDPSEHLGHFLVSHGYINEPQLADGMQRQAASNMLLGRILIDMKAIAEKDLKRMLRLKSEESIFQLFHWQEGESRFLDELPSTDMVPLLLDVTALVLEGTQRLDEWKRMRAAIRSKNAIPVLVKPIADPSLGAGERQLLSLVNDDRTVEEIALHCHSSEYFACRILFDQLQRGTLKIVNPRDSAAASAPAAIDSKALVRAGRGHMDKGRYEQGLRHLWAARSLDPENGKLKQLVQQAETRVHEALAGDGVLPSAVPRLARPMEELMKLQLSPQEGFLLTRVDGKYDIQSIQKISPMTALEGLLIFAKLHEAGHIALSAPAAKVKPATKQ